MHPSATRSGSISNVSRLPAAKDSCDSLLSSKRDRILFRGIDERRRGKNVFSEDRKEGGLQYRAVHVGTRLYEIFRRSPGTLSSVGFK